MAASVTARKAGRGFEHRNKTPSYDAGCCDLRGLLPVRRCFFDAVFMADGKMRLAIVQKGKPVRIVQEEKRHQDQCFFIIWR
uniref:Uncharacterized protein n=1 Tax=uncultured bacterium Contig46 TaxID=1393580 RepID=W0FHF0_9BACT|nr:hypothetical protein [uncultured bacterium Contig46]